MIETAGLTKVFGSTVAVDGLDLSVPWGEFFAFLGPNAAGKTTTIKMLAGLVKPTRGSAVVAGYDIGQNPTAAKALVSYVPDVPYLYGKLTAREFLRFVAELYGVARGEAERRIGDLLAQFEIEEVATDLIESYSHGLRQRVVFCACLLHDPRVIIVDEPMVGLDPRSARRVKDVLKRKSREGTTVFMSTHTLSVAEELADRVGIIHRGKLIAAGKIGEIRTRAGGMADLEEAFLSITREGGNG